MPTPFLSAVWSSSWCYAADAFHLVNMAKPANMSSPTPKRTMVESSGIGGTGACHVLVTTLEHICD